MSASKAKGTRWESAVVEFLKGVGWPYAERRALSGREDQGDVAGIPGVVIECKNQNRQSLAEWLDEALTERNNASADVGAVWFKRVGRGSPGDGYVLMDGNTFAVLLKAAGY